ncbi:Sulfate transporter [Schizosaccharomyces pombe]
MSSPSENHLLGPKTSFIDNRTSTSRPLHEIPSYQSLARRSSTWKRANIPQQKPSLVRRINYYIPVLHWLPNYSLRNIIWDVLAGCSTACLSVPIALSFAQTFLGVPPIYILTGTAIGPILYCLFTACPLISIGPEAGMCLLIAENIHQRVLSKADVPQETAILVTGLIAFIAGIINLAAGLFRLGFLDALVSPVLLRGCILSISMIIMINQGSVFFGFSGVKYKGSDFPIDKLMFLIRNMSKANIYTTILSCITISLLIGCRNLKSKLSAKYPRIVSIPDAVIILLLGSFLSKNFDWHSNYGIAILGEIETTILLPKLPLPEKNKLHFITQSLQTGVMCSFLAFIDTVIAVKAISLQTNNLIRSNRELISLGAANIGSSLFCGLPICGGYLRTKCNIMSGARTQVATIACSVLILLATFFIMPVFSTVPTCMLASMVVSLGVSLFADAAVEIFKLARIRVWWELGIIFSIATCTMMFGLETGIIFGLSITVMQIIRHSTRSRIMFRSPTSNGTAEFILEDAASTLSHRTNPSSTAVESAPRILVVRIPEPLFFANVSQLEDRLNRLEKYGHPRMHPGETPYRRIEDIEVVVFDMVGVSSIDSSALFAFQRILKEYVEHQVEVHLVSLDPQVLHIFEKHGLLDLIGGYDHVQDSIKKVDALCDIELGV